MNRPETNATRIEEHLNALVRPDVYLYALIDLANVASEAPRLQRLICARNGICILGAVSPETQKASPWLIPIPSKAIDNTTCKFTVELAERSSAVSWLLSSLPPVELVQRLKVRTEAWLPDRYSVLLRYFDPRVLPVLHQVLRPQQIDIFFGLGLAWLYLDRATSLAKIALTPAPQVDCLSTPLDLDEEQTASLLDSAEIDAVMPELVKEEPDRFLALGNGHARFRFTQTWLARANHWSLDQFPQKVVFCTLALRLGPKFDETPAWQQALRRVAGSGMRLSEVIEEALGGASNEI